MKEVNKLVSSGMYLDGRYKLIRPLSKDGGTADVWLALDVNTIDEVYDDEKDAISTEEETGIKVAIKIYRPKNALDIGEQRFREEFKIVFNCHHTNLIQPINFSIYEGIPYLVLPYCEKGSSETLQGKINNSEDLWKYISDVASGLSYLHTFDPTIVHHDIKPANVLIDSNGNYAITDFGISSHRGNNPDGYDNTQSGTMAYMAPERFNEDYNSMPESDIWSLGATLYEIITGKVPFGEYGGQWQLENNAICPPIKEDIPSDIKKLIYDCLSPNVSKRPSAQDIYQASLNKTYPPKNRKWIYVLSALVVSLTVIAFVFFKPKEEEIVQEEPVVVLTKEESFQKALELMSSENLSDLSKGLSILDSLSLTKYTPAIYQLAYTFGYYNDSASLSRKKILGIDIYPKNSKKEYFPKDKQVNIKAISLLNRIVEIGDSTYPEINAEALYRLGCYYVNENDMLQKDYKRAKELLTNALEWSEIGNDQKLTEKIKRNLDQLKDI